MDPTKIFQYSNPGRLVFGAGALAELPREIGAEGPALLVTDPGVARSGILEMVTRALDQAGVRHELFDGVQADPPVEVIEQAAALYRQKQCRAIVGLGGGSSMDVAKTVAVVGTHGGTVKEYCSGRPIEGVLPPVVAVPTTAGTGSEVTAVAVVSDHESQMKLVLKNPALVPRVALLDPLLLGSVPPRVAAETGADALAHAVEACLSTAGHAVTQALSLSAIRMIVANLPTFVKDRRDVGAAGQMLLAACMAGMAFKNAGLGLAHAMAHPAGVYFGLSHGLSCALYLPAVMEFNAPSCPEQLSAVADAAGADVRGLSPAEAAGKAADAVRDLFRKVAIPATYSELGIDFRLQPAMLDEAVSAVPTRTNPRPADRAQVEALFRAPAA